MDVKLDKEIISQIKHIECFYEQAPPGYVKEEEERPEDSIPDEECNKEARDFLANAPSKGLWMPLGKEVKVMQCWRCKQYGHRTGDKECPMFKSGNSAIEKFREAYEDPMYHFCESSKKEENEKKKHWLQCLLDVPTTSDSSSSDKESKRHKKKKNKKHKTQDKSKKHKKKSTSSSDSDSDSDSKKHKKKKSKKSISPNKNEESKNRKRKLDAANNKKSNKHKIEESPRKKHKHKSKREKS